MAKVLEVVDGVEVSVETGDGHLLTVHPPSGRNAKVEIHADHLRLPVNAWVDTHDADLYAFTQRALAEQLRVAYRVVVKRKRGQPDDVPLEKIPSDFRIRDLEALDPLAGAPKPAAQIAQDVSPADPAPAPVNGSQGRTCGLCGQSVDGGPPVRMVAGRLEHVACPGHPDDRQVPPVDPGPPTAEPPSPASNGCGPKMAEGKPWEFYNSDGTLNPGSYAYGAAEGMVLLAVDLLLAQAKATVDDGGFRPPTEPQIRALAKRLLRAADRAQANLRDDGHVARMASSHSRCRAAVRNSLDVYPVPFGGTAADVAAWEDAVVDQAGILLRLTVELVDPEALR